MTGVGTPLFAAPELMRGEVYDESVDVYSFAILLLAMAVEEDLPSWFQKRYEETVKKSRKPQKIMRILRLVWEDGWRPYNAEDAEEVNNPAPSGGDGKGGDGEGVVGGNPLSFAPPTIRSLIVRCGSHDPKARPTFEQIMEELEGPVLEEILEGYAPFPEDPNRKVPFKRRAILPPAAEEGGDGKRDDGAETRRPSLAPSLEGTFGSGSSFGEGDDAVEFNVSSNPMTSTMAKRHAKRLTALYLGDEKSPQQNWNNKTEIPRRTYPLRASVRNQTRRKKRV